MENLNCNFDNRKSFYGKAKVNTNDNTIELFSYDTKIAMIENGEPKIIKANLSQTSLRHTKEFFKQYGYTATNKNQMIKDYYKN